MTHAQSEQLKRRFLSYFRMHGNITWACRQAKITRRMTVYDWQERDDQFAHDFREAEIEATETMEAEAYRRAVKGSAKPVFHQGTKCGSVQEYSDTLLIFMLKARNPDKYRDPVPNSQQGGSQIKGYPAELLEKVQ